MSKMAIPGLDAWVLARVLNELPVGEEHLRRMLPEFRAMAAAMLAVPVDPARNIRYTVMPGTPVHMSFWHRNVKADDFGSATFSAVAAGVAP